MTLFQVLVLPISTKVQTPLTAALISSEVEENVEDFYFILICQKLSRANTGARIGAPTQLGQLKESQASATLPTPPVFECFGGGVLFMLR
jgi:hypothetical protein